MGKGIGHGIFGKIRASGGKKHEKKINVYKRCRGGSFSLNFRLYILNHV